MSRPTGHRCRTRAPAYSVSPAQVLTALADQVQAQRDAIQAELDILPGIHEARVAVDQANYEEAVDLERLRKIEWDAQPYHYGHTWRDEPPWKPTPDPYELPAHLIDDRDRPSPGFWVEYDLSVFSGGEFLTDSQKQIWRRSIREVADRGWIERDGRKWMRLTDAGVAKLTEPPEPPVEQTNDSPSDEPEQMQEPNRKPKRSLSQMQEQARRR
jgi:hypothetical protein